MQSNAIWQKKALVIFWTVDLIGLFATLVLAGLQTHEYESVFDGQRYGYNYFDGGVTYAAVGVIMIIFTLASFALDITTIVMFAVERFALGPKLYLAFQSIKTLLWTIMLILTCYGAGLFIGAFYYIISIALVFASIGQLVYGSVVLDRQRTGRLSDKEIGVPPHDGASNRREAERNPQNPFEDPVPASSAKGSGAVSRERFDSSSEAAEQSYEMHGSADRAA